MRQVSVAEIVQNTHTALTHTHIQRLKTILASDIGDLLPGNPCLLPAADPTWAGRFVEDALHRHLQEAESDFIDKLLCALATFIVERGYEGRRSDLTGVDLEFDSEGVRYLIAICPRINDIDGTSEKLQAKALRRAMIGLTCAVQPVLGYCYGRTPTGYIGGCLRVAGPNFWFLISGNPNLYADIIEIINQKVKVCRDMLVAQKACASNRMLRQFITRYCDENGAYNWNKFVAQNSCNLDLLQFLKAPA